MSKKYKDKEWLQEQVDKGLTQKEIGDKCNVSGRTISSWMKKFDIKPSYKTKTTQEFVNEIKELVGDEYTVLGEYKDAHTKISMKHNKCGHKYDVTPSDFVHKGYRCPKCGRAKQANSLRKTQKEFKEGVKNKIGDEYTVLGKYIGSGNKIKIRHNECGYEWKVVPNNFLQGSRCPKCQNSKGEKIVKDFLEEIDIRYKKEQKFDTCRNKRKLPFDFGIKDQSGEVVSLIEYDGEQHYGEHKFFKNIGFKQQVKHDHIKDKFALDNTIPLLRVNYMNRNNGVIKEKVEKFLKDNNIL